MNKTKIEWTDYTWNPVVGCKNGCWYCYGRRIRKRFHPEIPYEQITNYDERLQEPLKLKKPSRIFVGSMTDLFAGWMPQYNVQNILEVVRQCPQHTFQFLTKNPLGYLKFNFPHNCWIGVTNTGESPKGYLTNGEFDTRTILGFENKENTFLSCEPLLGDAVSVPTGCKWVIIGAMTGPRNRKYRPQLKWIDNILDQADRYAIPVFMKDSLKKVWKGKLRQEFPE